jgi:hypothetical protein
MTAIFLDPPYDLTERDKEIYAIDGSGLATDVREWAIAHGTDPDLRIALCGYESAHIMMPESWTRIDWKTSGGYGSRVHGRGRLNAAREVIWFSPHCLRPLGSSAVVSYRDPVTPSLYGDEDHVADDD